MTKHNARILGWIEKDLKLEIRNYKDLDNTFYQLYFLFIERHFFTSFY